MTATISFRPFDGLDNGRPNDQYHYPSAEPQAPYSGRMMNAKAIAHIKSKVSTPSKVSSWNSGLTSSSSFGSSYSNSSQKKKAPSHASYHHNAIVGRQTPLHSLNHSRRLAASRRADVFGMTALHKATRDITSTPCRQSTLSTSTEVRAVSHVGAEDVEDAFDDFEAYDENWAELNSSRRRREETPAESIGYRYHKQSPSDHCDVAKVDRMVSIDAGSLLSRTFSLESNGQPYSAADGQAYRQLSVGHAIGDGYQVSYAPGETLVFGNHLIRNNLFDSVIFQNASVPQVLSQPAPEVTGIALSGFLAEAAWKLVTEPFVPFEPVGNNSLDSSPASSGVQTPEVPWPARDPCIQSYSSLGRDATASPTVDNLHPKYFANLGIHGYEYRESMSPAREAFAYNTPVKEPLALRYNPYQLPARVPASFHDFVNKTLSQTLLSPTAIFLSLWYIKRFAIHTGGDDYGALLRRSLGHISTKPGLSFNGEDAARRILTLGLASANKWLDDNTFTNKSWSDVTGLNNTEINRLEMLALGPLSFDLSISLDDWNVWLQELHDGIVPCTHDRPLARQALSQVWQMLDKSNQRFEDEIVNRQGSPVVSAFDSPFSASADEFGLAQTVPDMMGSTFYPHPTGIATGHPGFDAAREKYMQGIAFPSYMAQIPVKSQCETTSTTGYAESALTYGSSCDRAAYADNLYLRSQQLFDTQQQQQSYLPPRTYGDHVAPADYWAQSEYSGYPYVTYDNHPMALPPIRNMGLAA
ncbi:hypothetical protein QFC21_004109 [Naganishia friedmannii]|uniref:Uncharacterized protein n=1 Tax=Naganishia friedmannii TaxID=89922 RepID=A0ACC2VJA0_9TREE|nr:hypothetical protein QFC21_004109 [Naganishia friedmannii]